MNDIQSLRERAKELQCLYAVDNLVSDRSQTPSTVFRRVLASIPAGWQNPASTAARIEYLGRCFVDSGFASDAKLMSVPIALWGNQIGQITVSDDAPDFRCYLPEEEELLRRISCRLSEFLEWKHAELLGEQTAHSAKHWAWRQRFAEALADNIDAQRFGVSRIFLAGSTARGDAKPGSDIDLYVECHGNENQKKELGLWLDGWSQCLTEVALQQTGLTYPGGILNVQWLSEEPGLWQRGELQELRLGSGFAR